MGTILLRTGVCASILQPGMLQCMRIFWNYDGNTNWNCYRRGRCGSSWNLAA
jgi:hypothetical protein